MPNPPWEDGAASVAGFCGKGEGNPFGRYVSFTWRSETSHSGKYPACPGVVPMRSLESLRSLSWFRSLLHTASKRGHESPARWISQMGILGTLPLGRFISKIAIVV